MTDDGNDPDFQQLLIRWYRVCRIFGSSSGCMETAAPINIPPLDNRDFGGGYLHTGQDNELWSYGEENYRIMRKYYDIRMACKITSRGF